MDQTKLRYCIEQVSILSDEDLALLLTCVQTRELKKGEVLLKQGEICHAFYLVDRGYLRTYYNKDDTAINLSFTFESHFTCNLKSYKSRQPSELIIEAGEDTSIWIFNIKLLAEHISSHPEISKFVRRLAIELLMTTVEHSNLFKIQTPTERYRYLEKNNPDLIQRIPLSHIASYLGVARETLSRIRAKVS